MNVSHDFFMAHWSENSKKMNIARQWWNENRDSEEETIDSSSLLMWWITIGEGGRNWIGYHFKWVVRTKTQQRRIISEFHESNWVGHRGTWVTFTKIKQRVARSVRCIPKCGKTSCIRPSTYGQLQMYGQYHSDAYRDRIKKISNTSTGGYHEPSEGTYTMEEDKLQSMLVSPRRSYLQVRMWGTIHSRPKRAWL